eukprot:m.63307 g.63307  ORF g.63307 m.63307 type:complete len:1157 (+) comp17772_c0_seq1:251-3721(+)
MYLPLATPSDENDDVAYVILSAIAVVAVATFAASICVSHISKRLPQRNLSKIQSELAACVQSGGAMFALDQHEIGIALVLDKRMAEHAATCSDQGALAERVGAALMRCLRQHTSVNPLLVDLFKEPETTIDVNPAGHTALLRAKRLRSVDAKRNGPDEHVASIIATVLNEYVRDPLLSVDGVCVDKVLVAVPHKPVQMIDRHEVFRLRTLSRKGASRTVVKAYLHGSRNRNPVTAAVVIPKQMDVDDVIRELAMMALFDHSNVVSLFGMVTSRNVPPQLVLEYCELGTLLDVAQNSTADDMSTAMQLTCCRDVARGLHYLSSLGIVHGDISAGNILVDAARTCKIAQFSKAAQLAYAALDKDAAPSKPNYLDETVPWSAPEVLRAGAYTTASDVWAYGVLVYEVVSRGAVPYPGIPTSSVAERVQAGYTMGNPAGCNPAIFALVMKPCWEESVANRPSFFELCGILEDLGAECTNDSAFHLTETAKRHVHPNDASTLSRKNWEAALKNREELGVSVHHIRSVLTPLVINAIRSPWKDAAPAASQHVHPTSATIHDAMESVINPMGCNVVSPRDGVCGCAYVDTLDSQDEVGHADVLLSYCSSYEMLNVSEALQLWCERLGHNPKRTYVWMWCLCANHHRPKGSPQTPADLALEIGNRVLGIGSIIAMLDPWDASVYMSHAWCLMELYTAISERGVINTDVVLTKASLDDLSDAVANKDLFCVNDALRNAAALATSKAATRETDTDNLRQLIQSLGGFAAVASDVGVSLRDCLVVLERALRFTDAAEGGLSDDSQAQAYELVTIRLEQKEQRDLIVSAMTDDDDIEVEIFSRDEDKILQVLTPATTKRQSIFVVGEAELGSAGGIMEFKKTIADQTQTPGDTPPLVVIMSGAATDAEKALASGADAVLFEPLTREFAHAHIQALAKKRSIQWQCAPILANESGRIQALNDLFILDTPPEIRFDRYTKLAVTAFNVPIALISLVDPKRQWFKSCIGLGDTTETPRDQAFCAHTILADKPMIVPDTAKDARFADNPLVLGGPLIRFYAGCPLTLPAGDKVGTLCIIDTRPRTLTSREIELLTELADLVVDELLVSATVGIPSFACSPPVEETDERGNDIGSASVDSPIKENDDNEGRIQKRLGDMAHEIADARVSTSIV